MAAVVALSPALAVQAAAADSLPKPPQVGDLPGASSVPNLSSVPGAPALPGVTKRLVENTDHTFTPTEARRRLREILHAFVIETNSVPARV